MDGKPNDSNNYCESANDPDKKNTGQVIHWYAEYDDTHSDYRKERMGVITLKESVDITGMDYLSFYIYASGIKGEGTLSLSNMYLQLVDSSGKAERHNVQSGRPEKQRVDQNQTGPEQAHQGLPF